MIEQAPRNKAMGSTPATKSPRPTCSTCGYYDDVSGKCNRHPKAIDKSPSDFCGDHQDFAGYLKSLTNRG